MDSSWWLDGSLVKVHRMTCESRSATWVSLNQTIRRRGKKVMLKTRHVQCHSKVLPAKTPSHGEDTFKHTVPSITTTRLNIQCKCRLAVAETCVCAPLFVKQTVMPCVMIIQIKNLKKKKVSCLIWNPVVLTASIRILSSESVLSRPPSPCSVPSF